MNYFLHYDNANPIFIGGPRHGGKMAVPLDRPYVYTYEMRPLSAITDIRGYVAQETLPITRYRKERIIADGRTFFVMVEESLSVSAAIMLMFQTVAESPDLRLRVKELERENRILRQMLTHVMP